MKTSLNYKWDKVGTSSCILCKQLFKFSFGDGDLLDRGNKAWSVFCLKEVYQRLFLAWGGIIGWCCDPWKDANRQIKIKPFLNVKEFRSLWAEMGTVARRQQSMQSTRGTGFLDALEKLPMTSCAYRKGSPCSRTCV
jgi:hypothetical protein